MLFFTAGVMAQVEIPQQTEESIIEEKIENTANTADESTDLTELTDQLQYYLQHPINLNTATMEELMESGLFTQLQVNSIIDHRNADSAGAFISIYELQVNQYLSISDIYNLLPYITIGDVGNLKTTFRKIFTKGQSRLMLRSQRYIEKSRGYEDGSASDKANPAYPGSPWKIYTQYQYRYKQQFSFNITAEKDAGEEFFKGSQKNGFDFYSAHLAIRNMGIVRTAVIGDYDLSYGQGLTLLTGLAFGKSPDVANVRKITRGIKPYASVNETSFKRGAAVSIGRNSWSADAFYSSKKLDANITTSLDSTGQPEDVFTSFQESGYHRTKSELEKKNAIHEQFFGGNVTYRQRNFNIGVTGVHAQYNTPFNKSFSLYNQFDFSGNQFTKTGVDYSWLFRNINFFGEFSHSNNGSIAYVNGAIVSLGSIATFSIVNRNYPRDFNYLFARGFAESSTTHNEKGTYAGLVLKPNRYWTLSGYYDLFTFPWLRYGVDAPSFGYEYLYQLTWTPSRNIEIYFRGRRTQKEENTGEPVVADYLVYRRQDNYRFNISYKISRAVTLKTRVEAVRVNYQEKAAENGLFIYQDVLFKPLSSRISGSLRYGLFDTDSYDSRIYAFENDILGSYAIPSFYYRGFRYYATLRYNVSRGIDVWLRYAQTIYDNRKTVGTGLDELIGNKRSEIKLQMRFQF
jgi:hypothetical protein